MTPLLSVRAAALILDRSERYIRMHRDEIGFVRVGKHGALKFEVASLERWVARHRQPSTVEPAPAPRLVRPRIVTNTPAADAALAYLERAAGLAPRAASTGSRPSTTRSAARG